MLWVNCHSVQNSDIPLTTADHSLIDLVHRVWCIKSALDVYIHCIPFKLWAYLISFHLKYEIYLLFFYLKIFELTLYQ